MAEAYSTAPTAYPGRRSWGTYLVAGLALLLIAATGVWALSGRPGLPALDLFALKPDAPVTAAPSSAATSPATVAAQVRQASERVEAMTAQQGGLDQRVAAMEQRLSSLDLQTQAAAGNAARAEGLLVSFASRRAIERGTPLGYLADQLRLRFGDAQPNAVQTVIDFSRDPVTLDQLLAQLDGLAPDLAASSRRVGLLGWMAREMGGLFVVRHENAPSPQPQRRLERARLFLESGRALSAVAEVRNLPNAAQAANWIADARRYAAAQRALELLETAALLEPRDLRDGEGNSVAQMSPAAGG